MLQKKPFFNPMPIPTLALALSAAPLAAPVFAQQGGGLEEVVVTAQRTEGTLQSTPIAITAFTSNQLTEMGVTDVAGIGNFAPNVSIEPAPGTSAGMGVFIRGIGTVETALTADPKIGVYIDDVYMSKTMGGMFDILDIERMEILRGPQGTLFGRNTTGGAINVTTVKPKGEFAAKLDGSVGNFGYRRYGATVDLPAVANIASKFAYYATKSDGWATNHWQGPPMAPADEVAHDLGSKDDKTWMLALRWTPTSDLTVDYSYDRTSNRDVPDPFQVTAVKNSIYDGLTTTPFDFRSIGGPLYQQMADNVGNPKKRHDDFDLDGITHEWLRVRGQSLKVEWQLDDVTLKYILGNRSTRTGYGGTDYGGTYFAPDAFYGNGATVQVPEYGAGVNSKVDMTTHEFQIFGSAFDDKLDYTGGLFLYHEKISQDQPQSYSLPVAMLAGDPDLLAAYQAAGFCDSSGACTGSQRMPLPFPRAGADPNQNGVADESYGQTMKSWAVYGQGTYALTDALNLTVGLRYTEEKRSAWLFNEALGQTDISQRLHAHDHWDNVSGVVNLSYQINSEMMVYAKYSTGFNGGVYNARAGTAAGFLTPAQEETVKTYELGLKSEWFGNRLRFNAAAFRNNYYDIQINQLEAGTGGAASRIVNAGEGVYQGFEFDLTAAPVDGLTINLNYGYLDAKFNEYIARNPVNDQEVDISSATTVPFAPKNTAALGVQYEFPRTSIGLVTARVDVDYKDRLVFHPFQNQYDYADPRTLVNARLSLSEIPLSGDGKNRLRLSLWGKNLTDENYRSWGIDFGSLGFTGDVFGEPRTYGLDIRYEYN